MVNSQAHWQSTAADIFETKSQIRYFPLQQKNTYLLYLKKHILNNVQLKSEINIQHSQTYPNM